MPLLSAMALRKPCMRFCKPTHSFLSIANSSSSSCTSIPSAWHSPRSHRSMATVVPPVTQSSTSRNGPTAMVFMNMGGPPQTTDAVGPFLSRLFADADLIPLGRLQNYSGKHIHKLCIASRLVNVPLRRSLSDSAMQPRIADGEDGEKLTRELSILLESGWQLDEEDIGVQKTYHLKTYTKVLVRILQCLPP